MPASGSVHVIPLGGAGEIGKNMYVVEHDERIVVIDCGITFPKNDQMGVDIVLPDFGYLIERADRVEALILTHGHEDHIGAVPFLLRAIGPVPIHGRRFTLALLRTKLEEHRLLDKVELNEVRFDGPQRIGPFDTEFVPLTHSTPDCAAVALSTPAGTIVHTGDFGIEYAPVGGRRSDLPALARLGERGVQLLLADSTNAEEGPMPSALPTRGVRSELARIFATARGRVLVTTFSSHIHRVQQVLDAAYDDGRVVALVGRSLTRNVNMAANLTDPETGRPYLTPPPGTLVRLRELDAHPRDEQVLICTGSQGEPMAALSRIARGEHNQVSIEPGDTVLYSSSTVPGNELAVNEIVNRLVRAKADFITERQNPRVHVSGHGSASDLLLMLELLRPRFFAPIHGEARHQRAHADLAEALGIGADRTLILDNGDVLEVTPDAAAVVDRVHAGLTYVDQAGGGDITESILRDRRHLADDGLVVVIARVDASDGTSLGDAEIITRGFGAAGDEELIEETRLAVERSLAASSEQQVTEIGILQHQLHDAVTALVRKRTSQRPLVVPVIVEV
ncbi:ribonuclease J [Miltoncostaea marina]|uniref:ribonuclease J n=1 Tax=Miltoncostaea marina TaxID=2843215 RepID=UPI001C3D272E|nr:ribonuclease J [Miltoncostaea marina]